MTACSAARLGPATRFRPAPALQDVLTGARRSAHRHPAGRAGAGWELSAALRNLEIYGPLTSCEAGVPPGALSGGPCPGRMARVGMRRGDLAADQLRQKVKWGGGRKIGGRAK